MKYILKATLVVASISSLNAGSYWTNATSFVNSFKNSAAETAKSVSAKAMGAAQIVGSKAQSLTASGVSLVKPYAGKVQDLASAGLKSTQSAAKNVAEFTVKQAGNLKTQAGAGLTSAQAAAKNVAEFTAKQAGNLKTQVGTGLTYTQEAAKKAVEATANGAISLKTKAGEYATQFAEKAGQKLADVRGYINTDALKQHARNVFAKINSPEGRKYAAGTVVVLGSSYAIYKWYTRPSKKDLTEQELKEIAQALDAGLPEQNIEPGDKKTVLSLDETEKTKEILDNVVRKLNISDLTEDDIRDRENIINFLKTLPSNLFENEEFVELYILQPGLLPQLKYFRNQLDDEQYEQLDELVKQYRLTMGF